MRRLKAGIRRAIAAGYYRSGAFKHRFRGRVLILAYHRVLTRAELSREYVQPGMYVRDDVFARQMRFLKEHFEIVELPRLLSLWREGRIDPGRRYCVVTFDDGWLDNYLHAYPVLRSLGIPATIFLPTAFVGTDEWFWPDKLAYLVSRRRAGGSSGGGGAGDIGAETERAISRWKRLRRVEVERALEAMREGVGEQIPRRRVVVNWAEVAEMSAHGVAFGSHSMTHAILTRESPADVVAELEGSWQALRERDINRVPVFSYPNGDYSGAVAAQVRAAGYVGALAGAPGLEGPVPGNVYALRRMFVHNDVCATPALFALRMSGLLP